MLWLWYLIELVLATWREWYIRNIVNGGWIRINAKYKITFKAIRTLSLHFCQKAWFWIWWQIIYYSISLYSCGLPICTLGILFWHSNQHNWTTFVAQGEDEDQHNKNHRLLIALPPTVAVVLLLGTMICYLRSRVIKSRGNFSKSESETTSWWSSRHPFIRWRC